METVIKNIGDLKLEIGRLKTLEVEQSVALKARFNGPVAIFATMLTLFPKSPTVDGVKSAGFFNQDFLGLLSRFALPIALNKTLFKKSNFIVKTLVGILSQKASHYISEDNVTGIWGKAKGMLTTLFNKKDKKEEVVVAVVNTDDVPPYQPY